MGKVTFINAIVSGKLAGTTYARNKAGYYIKQWTKPNDPKSIAQLAVRAQMGQASSLWHALSDGKKQLWNSFANNIFVPKFAIGSTVSGFNAFVSLNSTVAQCNRDFRTTTVTAPASTTATFDDFVFSDTPPIAGLSAAIQTSTGAPLPIFLTGATIDSSDYSVTATFNLAGIIIAVPEFIDSASDKPVGIMLQMSIPQVQVQGFVQGKNMQTIGIMKPPTLTNASWTGNLITISMAADDSAVANYKTAISTDQVVSINAYLVSAGGEQKDIGTVMVTAA